MLNQKSFQITYLKKQGSSCFFSSCHGEHEKYKAVDFIHYIYDVKNYICDSKKSFCQMGNSKHFMAILAAVEKLQPTGIVLAG